MRSLVPTGFPLGGSSARSAVMRGSRFYELFNSFYSPLVFHQAIAHRYSQKTTFPPYRAAQLTFTHRPRILHSFPPPLLTQKTTLPHTAPHNLHSRTAARYFPHVSPLHTKNNFPPIPSRNSLSHAARAISSTFPLHTKTFPLYCPAQLTHRPHSFPRASPLPPKKRLYPIPRRTIYIHAPPTQLSTRPPIQNRFYNKCWGECETNKKIIKKSIKKET